MTRLNETGSEHDRVHPRRVAQASGASEPVGEFTTVGPVPAC
ncbi:hypothetical protein [Streptosporangium sp. NPDC002607]